MQAARIIPREQLDQTEPFQFGALGQGSNAHRQPMAKVPAHMQAARARQETPEQLAARVAAAEQKLADLRRDALAQGWEQGYQEGRAHGLAEMQQQAQNLADTWHQLLSGAHQAFADLEPVLAHAGRDLILEVARQVLRQQLKLHPDTILAVVREAVDLLGQQQRQAQIRLHPDDVALVEFQLGDHLVQTGYKLLPDTSLQRGDVLIQGQHGEIDARLATRWRKTLATLGSQVPWAQPQIDDAPDDEPAEQAAMEPSDALKQALTDEHPALALSGESNDYRETGELMDVSATDDLGFSPLERPMSLAELEAMHEQEPD